MVDQGANRNASHSPPSTALQTAPQNPPRHISSVPPEILAQIFHIHRDQHKDSVTSCDPGWVNDTPPSVRVSHVCSIWRETAVSEASLWTNLVATTRSSTFYDAMLQRSKQSLLTIAIEIPLAHRFVDIPLPEKDGYILRAAMIDRAANVLAELAASEAVRLRELRIKAPLYFIDRHIPALRSLSAPNLTLTVFHIENSDELAGLTSHERQPPDVIFAGGAGKLSHFVARYVSRQMQPPLSALTMFVLYTCAPMQLADINTALVEISATVTCLVLHIPIMPNEVLPLQFITMPALRVMELVISASLPSFDSDDTANGLLDRLLLLALSDLTLQMAWPSAGPLISRSACKLKKLTIQGPAMDRTMLLLEVTPDVRELSMWIFEPHGWAMVLMYLTFRNGMQLVPAMRSLSLFIPDESIDTQSFSEMIASRWVPRDVHPDSVLRCSRLDSIQVVGIMDLVIPDPDLIPLRNFVLEGLNLAVYSMVQDGATRIRKQLL